MHKTVKIRMKFWTFFLFWLEQKKKGHSDGMANTQSPRTRAHDVWNEKIDIAHWLWCDRDEGEFDGEQLTKRF